MRRITILSTLIALGLVAAMGRPTAQGNVAEIENVKDNLYVIIGGVATRRPWLPTVASW